MSDCLYARNIRKRIGNTKILKGLTFAFPQKGFVGISGPSGCGKTSLLRIVGGLDPAFAGSLIVLGQSISSLNEDDVAALRLRNIGIVFQNFELLELDTVRDNVRLPMEAMFYDGESAFEKKCDDLLLFVGLSEKKKARVETLSGGEKQRVAIARSLANDPKIVLADEPTGSLDEANSEMVFALLKKISLSRLVLVVSHDEETLKRYADRIIYMKDGEITDDVILENEAETKVPPTIRFAMPKPFSSVPFATLYRHAKSIRRAKRVRSYLCSSLICAGLVGLGLSLFVHSSIQTEIDSALSGFVKETSLVVEPVRSFASPLGPSSACTEFEARELLYRYRNFIDDYGVTLITNYEEVFCDENDFYIARSGKGNYRLEEFSARSINDFLWLDETSVVYPSIPISLSLMQVVIGLPYQSMFKLCYELGIERNYESLGKYLREENLEMLVYLSNDDAQFNNDDVFDIRGVIETEIPCLFHTDHLWNQHYFVDHLNFHPVQSTKLANMQEMFQLPYIHCEKGLDKLISKTRFEEDYKTVVYDPFNPSYLPSLYDDAHPITLNRTYLYRAEKYGMSFQNMRDLRSFCPSITGITPVSNYGYYADSSSLLSGFPASFYLCRTKEGAAEVSERRSIMNVNDADLPLALPSDIVSGNIADGYNSFWVIAGESLFDYGNPPSSSNEICLSSSLYNKWGGPKEIYVAAEISSEVVGETKLRKFSFANLTVTGVMQNDKDCIYVSSYWTFDFFLSSLGCSGFSLEPTGAVLDFSSKKDALESYELLKDNFPEYDFFCPTKEVSSTTSEVTNYIGVVLLAFSLLALVMAVMLFVVVMSLTVEECAKELNILFSVGISRKDRAKDMRMHVLSYVLSSAIPSLLSVIVLEVAVHLFVSKMFGSMSSFVFSWQPLAAIVAASLVLYALFALIIEIRFQKKKVPKE